MGDGPADDAKASRQADDPGQSDVPPADGVPEDLRKSLGRFHLIAVTEAVTYLALVSASVAHRVFGAANLVPAVGLVHGTVFLVYLAASFRLRRRLNWDTVTMIIIVLASVVPFGTLVVERRIARSPFSPKLPGVPERPSVIAHSASQQTTGLADPTADPRSAPPRPIGSGDEGLPAQYSSVDEPVFDLEIQDGETLWRFETEFLNSNWQCIWGRGCQGILDHPSEELQQGCCSVGAELVDDEAASVAANVAYMSPEIFQFHDTAVADGIFSDETMTNTRVIDGACIFLNRPGFDGGAGCALHLAALRDDESPLDWKPSVCWQLPIRVDWVAGEDGGETASLRSWRRRDWGEDGKTMAWWCTEAPEAYSSSVRVVDGLAEELEDVVGTEVFIQLKSVLNPNLTASPSES